MRCLNVIFYCVYRGNSEIHYMAMERYKTSQHAYLMVSVWYLQGRPYGLTSGGRSVDYDKMLYKTGIIYSIIGHNSETHHMAMERYKTSQHAYFMVWVWYLQGRPYGWTSGGHNVDYGKMLHKAGIIHSTCSIIGGNSETHYMAMERYGLSMVPTGAPIGIAIWWS